MDVLVPAALAGGEGRIVGGPILQDLVVVVEITLEADGQVVEEGKQRRCVLGGG